MTVDRWEHAERKLRRYGYNTARLPRIGDGVHRTVSYVQSYNELVAISRDRAAFLGELIQAQLDRANLRMTEDGAVVPADGDTRHADPYDPVYSVFIGKRYAMAETMDEDGNRQVEPVEVGEDIRALIQLEQSERKFYGQLMKDALKIGVELDRAETARVYGEIGAQTLRAFIAEIGLDIHSQDVLTAAQRAVYAGRRAAGQDDGDPDVEIGPALDETGRERARRPARALRR